MAESEESGSKRVASQVATVLQLLGPFAPRQLVLAPKHTASQAEVRGALDEVRALFDAAGARLHPSSRIATYMRVMSDYLERRELDESNVYDVLHAQLELDELAVIASAAATPASPEFLRRAESLLNDAAIPQRSDSHTQGRDAQFELVLAALAMRGRLKVDLGSPDLLVHHEIGPFAVEAKRVKGANALEGRLRKARWQLRGASCPGLVAVDLSALVSSPRMMREVDNFDVAGGVATRLLGELMTQLAPRVLAQIRGTNIAGWLGYVHLPFFSRADGCFLIWTHALFDGAIHPDSDWAQAMTNFAMRLAEPSTPSWPPRSAASDANLAK